jgi:Mn2+/Fe2+ NRAMP family transporter
MGRFVNPRWLKIAAWVVTAAIIVLNGYLLLTALRG